MLQLKGIYKTFNAGTVNEKRAIDNLNLTLEDGDFVTIIGGNGAGKSTTLNLIAGVYPVDAGMIHLNGYDLTNLPEHKRARFLGRVFQDPMMGTAASGADPADGHPAQAGSAAARRAYRSARSENRR